MEIKSESNMRAAYFKFNLLSRETFEGFTNGESCDGWVCPFFTYEEGRRILKIYNEPFVMIGQYNLAFYDLVTDAFVIPGDYENEPEIYRAITEDGQKYYPIGAGSWRWEEVYR